MNSNNKPKPFYYNKNRNQNQNKNQQGQGQYQNQNQDNKPKTFVPRQQQPIKQTVTELWISPSQVQNPIWSYLKIPFKTNENQVADFILPESSISVIFLSLQFHQNYPLYIEDKLDKFSKSDEAKTYWNKIMLCLFDAEDTNNQLMDLTILGIEKDIKILVGFSFSEIANYLASFKYIEKYKKGYFKDQIKSAPGAGTGPGSGSGSGAGIGAGPGPGSAPGAGVM